MATVKGSQARAPLTCEFMPWAVVEEDERDRMEGGRGTARTEAGRLLGGGTM
jgi:hypothetical protein